MKLEIIQDIIETSLSDRFETEEILREYYRKEGSNKFNAAEKAEASLRLFVDIIQEDINICREGNISCLFNDVSLKILNVNRYHFDVLKIRSELFNLSWQRFEDFCGVLITRCFLAENVKITPRTNDGGLDFSGIIPFMPESYTVPFGYIELYGQAKKYTNNIGRPEVDSFTAFANRQKRDHSYPAQIFLFCTTSDFASSAKIEIKKNNFIGLNGIQIATIVFMWLKMNQCNPPFSLSKFF